MIDRSAVGAAVAALRRELDRAAISGRPAATWWRDDDAVAATSELDRLLAIASRRGLDVTLAVIPDLCQPSLPRRIDGLGGISAAVHGWRHRDHAPGGEKRAEFGPHRPVGVMRDEAECGLDTLRSAFGPQALPVFVPPWNRIAGDLAATLPEVGYRALSCFGGGPARPDGLRRLDTHLDPIDWHASRGLLGPEILAGQLRNGLASGGPIGFLTHHLVHDETVWAFCESWADLAATHPALRPVKLEALLAGGSHDSAELERAA